MKKIVAIGMVTALLFSMTTIAQNPQCNQMQRKERVGLHQGKQGMVSPEKRAEFMAKQLGLNDAEKAKVQALFEKQAQKAKQHQEEMKKMREELQARMEAERSANQAELIKIIGQEKFNKLQSQRIERLEKENRMLKMMRKEKASDHPGIRIEKRKMIQKQQ